MSEAHNLRTLRDPPGTKPLAPVLVAHLFPELHAELMALLRGLAPEDWKRLTSAGSWRVRDVAAHLLDGDVRKLAIHRDGLAPRPERSFADYRDLVGYLNGLNAEWVKLAQRISPRILTDFLAVTGPQVAAFLAGLDPGGRALFPVAWAGESESFNWFDIGREYTERWHHQQQIREAVGAAPLTARKWLRPVLEVSVRVRFHTPTARWLRRSA